MAITPSSRPESACCQYTKAQSASPAPGLQVLALTSPATRPHSVWILVHHGRRSNMCSHNSPDLTRPTSPVDSAVERLIRFQHSASTSLWGDSSELSSSIQLPFLEKSSSRKDQTTIVLAKFPFPARRAHKTTEALVARNDPRSWRFRVPKPSVCAANSDNRAVVPSSLPFFIPKSPFEVCPPRIWPSPSSPPSGESKKNPPLLFGLAHP